MTYNAEFNSLATADTAPTAKIESIAADDASSYKSRLNRWAIARIFNKKPEVVARFRSRSDADGHLELFRQQFPMDKFLVIFDKQESS